MHTQDSTQCQNVSLEICPYPFLRIWVHQLYISTKNKPWLKLQLQRNGE